ncbi:CPBP family intramembrane metalloprotease [Hazenella sp. IB182353]|uniref:CPBP family intramembrane glutamic endopeptidase n=1 Tax=Polycladospora coralii TaxID=2771432 RepID=UPI00174781C8|nr:type II CAAX endopeptidase family protein [Polycladospora coralii]MBS7530222.1 CPBP family intramembrane metalloprotease [Polycladospora coralii]
MDFIQETDKGRYIPHPILAIFLIFSFFMMSEFVVILLNEWVSPIFYENMLVYFLSSFISLMIILFVWVRFIERRSLVTLGLANERILFLYGKGVLIGFLYLSICVLILWSFGYLDLSFSLSQPGVFLILPLFVFMIQAATEEILVRGWLFPVLAKRMPILVGAVISSLFFVVAHVLNPNFTWISALNIFLFGMYAVAYTLKEGGIWGICGWHMVWNFAQIALFGIPVSGITPFFDSVLFASVEGPDYMSGGNFGVEGSIVLSIVLGIATLYQWIYKK